jgi:hypothetical protein
MRGVLSPLYSQSGNYAGCLKGAKILGNNLEFGLENIANDL